MNMRVKVPIIDAELFARALTSGDFPTSGLVDFIEVDATAKTVQLRGTSNAIHMALVYLGESGVLA